MIIAPDQIALGHGLTISAPEPEAMASSKKAEPFLLRLAHQVVLRWDQPNA